MIDQSRVCNRRGTRYMLYTKNSGCQDRVVAPSRPSGLQPDFGRLGHEGRTECLDRGSRCTHSGEPVDAAVGGRHRAVAVHQIDFRSTDDDLASTAMRPPIANPILGLSAMAFPSDRSVHSGTTIGTSPGSQQRGSAATYLRCTSRLR